MKWRPLVYKLHRDIGFVCFGLTVVYAVSGIAVNHRGDWDYNYSKAEERRALGTPAAMLALEDDQVDEVLPAQLARDYQPQLVARLSQQLGLGEPRKVFWRGPDRLSLFYGRADSDVVDYLPSDGTVERTRKSKRPLLREFNSLHLNESRSVWTWFADGYAALLLFLALSGVAMVRGRRGLLGRGGILMAAGMVIPIGALWWIGGG